MTHTLSEKRLQRIASKIFLLVLLCSKITFRFTHAVVNTLGFRETCINLAACNRSTTKSRRDRDVSFSKTRAPPSHSHVLPHHTTSHHSRINHHLVSNPTKHSLTPCVLISPPSSPSGSASARSPTPRRRTLASTPRTKARPTLSGREWRTSWGLSAARRSSTRGELNADHQFSHEQLVALAGSARFGFPELQSHVKVHASHT